MLLLLGLASRRGALDFLVACRWCFNELEFDRNASWERSDLRDKEQCGDGITLFIQDNAVSTGDSHAKHCLLIIY